MQPENMDVRPENTVKKKKNVNNSGGGNYIKVPDIVTKNSTGVLFS